jgi:CRP-like cAMP-binding protein
MSDSMQVVGPMERTIFLKSLAVVRDLRPREVAIIAELARERHLKKGTTLLRRGERPDAFFIVVEGRIHVTGGEHPAGHHADAEEAVGLLSLIAQSDEGVDAVALVDSLVLEIDGDVLFDLCEEHFYFLHSVIRRLARLILEERMQIPNGEFLGRRDALIDCPERRLDFVERIVLIQRGGTFVNSGLDALASLARKTEEMRFDAGTAIWSFGERSGYTLMIISGVVECRQEGDRGTFYCGAGYPLGNLESLAGEARWYDALCQTDVVAMRVSTEDFLDMLEDDFQMATDFLQAFSTGLIRTRSAAVGMPMSGRGVVRRTWHAR